MLEATEQHAVIETIDPPPPAKRRGRPSGSKNSKPRVLKSTPKMQNPKKTESFAVGVIPQHYWLISAIAESQNVPRMVILERILNKYIATLGEK